MAASSPEKKQAEPIRTAPVPRKILPEVKFTGQQPGEEGVEKTEDTPAESREWARLEKAAQEAEGEERKYQDRDKQVP